MKIRLYTILIESDNKMKVRKKFLWFHINSKIKETYEYWIEFRIDEKRFWYGERKPVWNSDLDCYEMKTNYVMTKNGCERSINIIDGIVSRTSELCPTFKVTKNKNPEWYAFTRFDRLDREEQKELKGMFLN